MKKINFLFLLAILSVSVLLPSCNKDDDNSIRNEFVLNGTNYSLTKGFIEDFGDNGNGSYDFDVTLTSNSINYSDATGYYSGTGDLVYLDLNTSSETGLVSGTYNFSTTRQAFTFVDAQVGTGFDVATLTGDTFGVVGGTVEVDINGNEVTIDFNLTLAGNNTVEGNYKGTLRPI